METDLGSKQEKEGTTPSVEGLETVPLQLGAVLRLRSLADPTLKVATTVVGVIPKLAIMVEDPIFTIQGERITGRVGGDILCSYFLDGCLYKFKSRFGQNLIHNIVCIDYPRNIEAHELRMHPRIKVELEVVGSIGKERRLINGTIRDISHGGCCLELPGLIPLTPRTPVCTTFILPNDEPIEDLGCTIMNLRHVAAEKKTLIGLSFTGPDSELSKVIKFCEMCSYFRV
jgi:hypothetical protein